MKSNQKRTSFKGNPYTNNFLGSANGFFNQRYHHDGPKLSKVQMERCKRIAEYAFALEERIDYHEDRIFITDHAIEKNAQGKVILEDATMGVWLQKQIASFSEMYKNGACAILPYENIGIIVYLPATKRTDDTESILWDSHYDTVPTFNAGPLGIRKGEDDGKSIKVHLEATPPHAIDRDSLGRSNVKLYTHLEEEQTEDGKVISFQSFEGQICWDYGLLTAQINTEGHFKLDIDKWAVAQIVAGTSPEKRYDPHKGTIKIVGPDNIFGTAIQLSLQEELSKKDERLYDAFFVYSRGEEVGLKAAERMGWHMDNIIKMFSTSIRDELKDNSFKIQRPSMAIAIDTATGRLVRPGNGMINIPEKSAYGSYDQGLVKKFRNLGQKNRFNIGQIDIMGGACNADMFLKAGIPSLTVSPMVTDGHGSIGEGCCLDAMKTIDFFQEFLKEEFK